MTYTESSLQLSFDPEEWEVIAYDRHRYYNILKGAGLRGVDFMGIWRGETLVLLEIKNFRVRPAEQSAAAIAELLHHPGLLIEAMTEKQADTLKGLEGIEGYLRRRWWYRLLEPRFINGSTRWRKWFPQAFWARVFDRKSNLRTFLWLETDPVYEGWDVERVLAFREELRRELSKADITLVGNGDNPLAPGLMVSLGG